MRLKSSQPARFELAFSRRQCNFAVLLPIVVALCALRSVFALFQLIAKAPGATGKSKIANESNG